MAQYIDKAALVAEIKELIRANELYLSKPETDEIKFQKTGAYSVLNDLLHSIDTIEVKEVDLIDRKTDWSPSKKQLESLKDLLHYNIGVFDYQKFMEVNSLYENLIKLLDYETDRQK